MTSSDMEETSAVAFKQQGNAAYHRGDYLAAIVQFTKGLELGPGPELEHMLYSNRSACYCLIGDFARAVSDAERVIHMKPGWPKGHTRKGAALQSLNQLDQAAACYSKALELDPANEVAKKGLQDVSAASAQLGKRFTHRLSPKTKATVEAARASLEQLRDVRWHFEILKDRIWLADPPLSPFRPRSMFIIDVDRLQLLSMQAHPKRESLSLDQLVEFLLGTFTNSGIWPGSIEFSDYALMSALAPVFADFNMAFSCDQLSERKLRFFDEQIAEFEAKEQEQWQNNSKFAGVLRQRSQKGMLTIPGVTPDFLRHLLAAAAAFYRGKGYLYFDRPIGLTTEDDNTKVALLTRNALGQLSVAMSTVAALQKPLDCGGQSYTFVDQSIIPFDDADLIERFGWDVAEDKYPLPNVHRTDGNLQHPTVEDLRWYELAFRVLAFFLEETYARHTYTPPSALCCRCTVTTSQGVQEVRVTVPPAEPPGEPTLTLTAPPPPPSRERPAHLPSPAAPGATPLSPIATPAAPPLPPDQGAAHGDVATAVSPEGIVESVPAVEPITPGVEGHGRSQATEAPTPAAVPTPPPAASPTVGNGTGAPAGHVCVEQAEVVTGLLRQLEAERQGAAAQQHLIASQQAIISQQQHRLQELEKLVAHLQQELAQAARATGAAPRPDASPLREPGAVLNVDGAALPRGAKGSATSPTLGPPKSSSPVARRTSTSSPRHAGPGRTPSHAATASPPTGLRVRPPVAESPNQEVHPKPPSRTSHSDEGQKPVLVPGLFMAGPWEGRLAELPYLPQDLTVAEYLSPANCLF